MINIVKFVCVKVYMTICVPKCSEFLNSNFEAFVLEALALGCVLAPGGVLSGGCPVLVS